MYGECDMLPYSFGDEWSSYGPGSFTVAASKADVVHDEWHGHR